MPLLTVRHWGALFVLTLMGTAAMHGQSAVEYGSMTGNSAGVATSMKPLKPIPNVELPGSSSSAGPGAASSSPGVPAGTAESAAKTNLHFFQTQSGPDAARVAVHTVPDHAQAWIDGKFVGSTPLELKLAPGHHQVLVRAPNMHESVREFDLAAKQAQSIDVLLKSAYQNQVIIRWPPQK